MTIGEDGRPYIAVRRKTEEEKEKVQEGATQTRFNHWEEENPLQGGKNNADKEEH